MLFNTMNSPHRQIRRLRDLVFTTTFLIAGLATAQTPTLNSPVTNAVTSSPVTVSYTLPVAALPGTVTLSFGSTVLTLAASQETAGAHSFTFNPANPTASEQIVSGAAIPDGSYTVTLSYQDSPGNASFSAVSTNVTLDTLSQTPTLTAPATNGSTKNPISVSFNLPEAAKPGSLKLIWAGPLTMTFTLAAIHEGAGAHSFTFNHSNLASNPNFASVTGGTFLPLGTYSVTLSYQDALDHPAATAIATNFLVDYVTVAPTLTSPAANTAYASPIPINFTLPEAALPGSVKLIFHSAGAGAPLGSLILAGSMETAGTHAFSLNPANLLASPEVASAVNNVGSPISTIADRTALAELFYQDTIGNSIASHTRSNVTIDTTAPAGGTMSMTPASPVGAGAALTVNFASWTDGRMPLAFAVLVDDVIVSAPGETASRNITGPSALGTHTLKGRIFDSLGNMREVTQNFTVEQMNEMPSFTKGADQTVNEDAAAQTVTGWATSIDDGNPEVAQALTFNVTSDNHALFSTQPAVSPDGTLTYTPALNANGAATVSVTLTDDATAGDAALTTAAQTFTIAVTAVNDVPTLSAIPDPDAIDEDSGQQNINLTGIGTGAANEIEPLTVTATSSNTALIPDPTVTYTSSNATGTLSYTPLANANGIADITIAVDDGQGSNNTAMRTFTVNVTAINDSPGFAKGADLMVDEDESAQTVSGWASAITDGDPGVTQALAFNATNDNNALFFAQPVVAPDGTLTFTPAPNANGNATVSVTLTDDASAGGTALTTAAQTFTITVNPVNDAPVATAQSLTTNEDTALPVTLTGGDTENSPLNFSIVTGPAHGTLTGSGASRTYTPLVDYHGPDSFTFLVNDGTEGSEPATVTLTIDPVNDAPVAIAQSLSTNEDTALPVTLTGSDTENSPLNFSIVTGPAHGTLTGSGASRTYTPAANYHGPDRFTFRANDGADDGEAATVTLTVDPVNDAPVVSNIANLTTDEDTPTGAISFSVGDLETSADLLLLGWTSSNTNLIPIENIVSGGSGSNRTVTLMPAANQYGSSNITITVSDGILAASDTFTLTVNHVNDVPTISAIPDQTTIRNLATRLIHVEIGDADSAPFNFLGLTATSDNPALVPTSNIAFSDDGTNRFVTVTPALNQTGSATITITVSDGFDSASEDFILLVSPASMLTAGGPDAMFDNLTNAASLGERIGLFSYLNTYGITDHTIIQITGDLLNERGQVALNAPGETPAGANYSIRMFPVGAPRTINSTGGTTVRLNGADRVTIDGSLNGTGNDRSLTITNSNTTGLAAAVIWLQNNGGDGATNNTLENLNIGGTSTNLLFGIGCGGTSIGLTSLGSGNHQNVIRNNSIADAAYGIFSQGAGAAAKNTGTRVTGNLLTSPVPQNARKGGILFGFEDGVEVSNNRISDANHDGVADVFGISLGGPSFGNGSPAGNEVTNATVTGNVIDRMTHQIGMTVAGIHVASATSGITLVANNSISGLVSKGTTGSDFAAGILLGNGAGSTTRIYFNSVSLWGEHAVTHGTPNNSFGIAMGGNDPTVDLRGNVFSNMMRLVSPSGPVSFGYALGTASPTLANLVSDRNDLFVASGNEFRIARVGSLSASGGVDHTTLTDWQVASGRDTQSISADPLFNSPSIPFPLAGSPLESAATPLAEVSTDLTGTLRSLTAPTIGAYETPGDHLAPAISFTPLTVTLSLANRRLSGVTITDMSGVASAPGQRPRLYFKKLTNANLFVDNTPATDGWKFVEADGSGGSPFDFLINYALLQGGVSLGDTMEYFLVAADLASAQNSGNSSIFFTSPPADINLAPDVFPVGGAIQRYRIVAPLAGTVTVGPGGDFPSLTLNGGLFQAMNQGILTGNLRAEIIGDLGVGNFGPETGLHSINEFTVEPAGSPFTLTIVPVGAPRQITGNSFAPISINGADRVTIDGSLNGTGSDRSLTITNTNTSAAASPAVIWIQSAGTNGATNNVLQNLNIRGSGDNQTLFGIGSGGTSISLSSLGSGNHQNTFRNNSVSKAKYGIFSQGESAANKNTGTLITGNLLNAAAPDNLGRGGILLGFEDHVQITGNHISNVTQASPDLFGISLGGMVFDGSGYSDPREVTNATVSGNVISGITNGNFSVAGIGVAEAASGTTFIANNSISGVGSKASISDLGAGIFVDGGGGSTTNVFFNSVHIHGTFVTSSSTPQNNFALAVAGTDPLVSIRNNVFSNTAVFTGNGGSSGTSYAIGTSSLNFANVISDHNDLFVAAGSGFKIGKTGSLTRSEGTDQSALADWQNATGQDVNSISADPLYASSSDLTPLPGSLLDNAGIPIADITTDILGVPRHSSTPTIGAYEITIDFSPLETWRQIHFGSTANAGNAADDFDFDKDGHVNLIEFAFGLNPTIADAHLMPQAQCMGNELVISFTQPPGVSGVTYGAQSSETMAPGSWQPVPDTGTAPVHEFKVAIGSKKKDFVQLTVTGQAEELASP